MAAMEVKNIKSLLHLILTKLQNTFLALYLYTLAIPPSMVISMHLLYIHIDYTSVNTCRCITFLTKLCQSDVLLYRTIDIIISPYHHFNFHVSDLQKQNSLEIDLQCNWNSLSS